MPPKILLADDNITIQKIVHQTFENQPVELISVGNGEAAVRKALEVHPQVVLADIFMPGKNGYEVCEFIKQHSDLASTRVILLVGAFEPFDEKEAARVQADDHLKKPFDPQMLLRAVRKFVEFEVRPLTKRRAASAPEERLKPQGTVREDERNRAFAKTEHMTSPVDQTLVHSAPPAVEEPVIPPLPPVGDKAGSPPVPFAAMQPPSAEMPLEISHVIEEPSIPLPQQAEPLPDAPPEGGELLEGVYTPPTETAQEGGYPGARHVAKTVDYQERTEKMEVVGWENPPVPATSEETQPISRSSESEVFGPRDASATGEEISQHIPERSVSASTPVTPPPLEAEVTEWFVDVAPSRGLPREGTHVPATMEELMGVKSIPIPGGEMGETSRIPPASDSQQSEPSPQTSMLSEEVLDRIARRVVEHMSKRVVEEVAWEVVPEIAESILRKNLSKNK